LEPIDQVAILFIFMSSRISLVSMIFNAYCHKPSNKHQVPDLMFPYYLPNRLFIKQIIHQKMNQLEKYLHKILCPVATFCQFYY